MANSYKTAVPPEVIQKVTGYLNKAFKELGLYTVSQTPGERRHRPGLGEKSFNFMDKSYKFASANPQMVPAYLDMQEFEADFSDVHELGTIRNLVKQLLGKIETRRRVSGSGALTAALKFYQNVKNAAGQDFPGAQEVYRDLRVRFLGMGKKKTKTAETGGVPALQ
jgi:hypothetical protein